MARRCTWLNMRSTRVASVSDRASTPCNVGVYSTNSIHSHFKAWRNAGIRNILKGLKAATDLLRKQSLEGLQQLVPTTRRGSMACYRVSCFSWGGSWDHQRRRVALRTTARTPTEKSLACIRAAMSTHASSESVYTNRHETLLLLWRCWCANRHLCSVNAVAWYFQLVCRRRRAKRVGMHVVSTT